MLHDHEQLVTYYKPKKEAFLPNKTTIERHVYDNITKELLEPVTVYTKGNQHTTCFWKKNAVLSTEEEENFIKSIKQLTTTK